MVDGAGVPVAATRTRSGSTERGRTRKNSMYSAEMSGGRVYDSGVTKPPVHRWLVPCDPDFESSEGAWTVPLAWCRAGSVARVVTVQPALTCRPVRSCRVQRVMGVGTA